jgi:hypothetical protein
MQLHAVTRSLCAIAAGGHVAPAPTSILGFVLEHSAAPWIGAPPHSDELSEDERISRTLDDRDEEARECVTDRDERAHEGSVAGHLEAPRAGAAAEHAIDLRQCLASHVMRGEASLRERTQYGATAARAAENRQCTRGLLMGAPTHACRALCVEQVCVLEPPHEALEIMKTVRAANGAFRVYEVEPQPLRNEGEWEAIALVEVRRRCREFERGCHWP